MSDEKLLPPIHPGEILMEEFLLPMGISQYRLAKYISVPPRRINEIVHGMQSSIYINTYGSLAKAVGKRAGEPIRISIQDSTALNDLLLQ